MKEKMPNKCFLFDVDGTLTEPRQRMTEEFALFFSDWMEGKDVFLVSGSDFPKIKIVYHYPKRSRLGLTKK